MILKDILLALQSREMNPEDAKKALVRIMHTATEPHQKLNSIIASSKDGLKVHMKKRSVDLKNNNLLNIEEISEENGTRQYTSTQDVIAIIGISGRYPGASNLEQYWDNLVNGKNLIQEIPNSRWDVNLYYDPQSHQNGKVNCKWLGILDDIEYFDSQFFNIPHSKAAAMDPQHRIFLQEGYKAFEDAGYCGQSLNNQICGVYLGLMSGEYAMMLYKNKSEAMDSTGNSAAIAAARIPYFFNLKGPAISIDTACSSSLVAVHLASQALWNHEIDMALVGGVSLYLTPESYISMCAAEMLSPDGQCKTCDNNANGFVPGEGVGALVLKRLKDAETDGDHIYGVIIASGINQNGNTNGITAPSVNSQIELERGIYDKYKIDPESISYVEMHGTGTKLGDSMELEALSTVFEEKTKRKHFCRIGSVKSNIGHTSAAAGVASIHKVLLSMIHQKLVPTLNFTSPNEHFNFEDSPFIVNTELKTWEDGRGECKRAAVSSFGYSGSNAHLVIEEYQPKIDQLKIPSVIDKDNPILFILSARNNEQLKKYAQIFKEYLETHEDLNLRDLVYTLQVGRKAMEKRFAVIADSRKSLLHGINDFINDIFGDKVLSTNFVQREFDGSRSELDNTDSVYWIHKRELGKVAELWIKGHEVKWNELYSESKPYRISLPTYPFVKEFCWVEGINPQKASTSAISYGSNKNSQIPEVYSYNEPCLRDHTVYGEQVLIGPTYVSLAINNYSQMFPIESSFLIHRLNFIKPVIVHQGQKVEIVVNPVKSGFGEFHVLYRYSLNKAWDVAATGNMQAVQWSSFKIDLKTIKDSLKELTQFDHIYTCNPAIHLGDSYKIIKQLFGGKDLSLARIVLPDHLHSEDHNYLLNPLMVHNAYHAINTLVPDAVLKNGFLPFGIQNIYYQKNRALTEGWLLVKLVKNFGEMIIFDVDIINDQHQVIASYQGCSVKKLRLNTPEPQYMRENILPEEHSPSNTFSSPMSGSVDLTKKIQQYLTNKISQIVPFERADALNVEINLMDLGINSIQLVSISDEIERELSIELNPTLFFEFSNIKSLTEFFSREHQDAFQKLLGADSKLSVAGGTSQVSEINSVLPQFNLKLQSVPNSSFFAKEYANDDIAIIGMDGLFAEAKNISQFWDNLLKQKDLIKEVPIDHWDYRPWFDEDPNSKNKTYCKWGSFIDDVDKFDPGFFNISPREADWMDPQLRLLMQSIYATAEDAGCINGLRGSDTGVFVGVCRHDYMEWMAEMNIPVDPYIGTGNTQTVFANRISFLFDLTGPSIAVDTACSSTLIALHQACQSLRNRECSMAFVGGVNLLLSSYHYRYFSSIKALSPTGHCHSFDAAADGYVPGECIASILLKPLKQAQKDGSQIYAVIKGSAALHGGYTPSLTAPSVSGEENVLVKAWQDAGIDPATITYIEAHGTGTKLGDPIEINSLKKAFKQFTVNENFCAIGTVKANIGHAEGAAGIAGILKVIMQLKHKKIPVMPMLKQLNPYIDLNKSALYINQEVEEWKSPDGIPRRAGVSSFGFAGAFAHVVIEEYLESREESVAIAVNEQNPVIILLSAKDEERLRERVKQLINIIKSDIISNVDLANLAFTLQVGREAMEERMGCIVSSMDDLQNKLNSFLSGNHSDDLYSGQVKRNNEMLAIFKADEELQEAIDKWILKKKYTKLVELWVKGLFIDWNKLYGEFKPYIISLPTYPFSKERCWVQTEEIVQKQSYIQAESLIHPLLHQNTSDFLEQRYQTIVTGEEFYLRDHVVKGRKMLPGVAYLEMARAAIRAATKSLQESTSIIRLKNIVWIQPIRVEKQPIRINIRLFPKHGVFVPTEEIDFEINSSPLFDTSDFSGNIELTLNCQGKALLNIKNEIPTLDIESLRNICSQSVISAEQLYHAFNSMGFTYGPAQRGVEEILVGEEQLLVRLALPLNMSETNNKFVLHPCIMDSALQASLGLILGKDDLVNNIPVNTTLPFAMEEIEIIGSNSSVNWAWIRYGTGTTNKNSFNTRLQKIDVDLCDDQGNVQVRIKGFSSRILDEEQVKNKEPENAVLMFEPIWKEQPLETGSPTDINYEQHLVIFCEPENAFGSSETLVDDFPVLMEGIPSHQRCLVMQSKHKNIEDRFESYVSQIFKEIQNIINMKPEKNVLIQVVVSIRDQDERQVLSGVSGLLKTAHLENPKIIGQIIEFHYHEKLGNDINEIVTLLEKNSYCPQDTRIRYQNGQRMVMSWNEFATSLEKIKSPQLEIPWRDHGTYLITGGTGKLGLIIANEIVTKAKNVQLILVGRSSLSDDRLTQFKELETFGAKINIISVDITNKKAVSELFRAIHEEFGTLDGIIHGAGIISDNFIYKKTLNEFQAVLGPKVSGLVNIDNASKDFQLDFFILFSSIAGSLGNPGQADYAAANAFMDVFASYRNFLVSLRRRYGKTLSINWPLWKDGGMRINEETEKINFESFGIVPMESQNGIDSLYQSLASGRSQVMVLEGSAFQLRKYINSIVPEGQKGLAPNRNAISLGNSLQFTIFDFVKKILAKLIKFSPDKISVETPFEKYGVDSILQMSFIHELEKVTGELSKTLLFEYNNISELGNYLMENYSQQLTRALTIENNEVDVTTISLQDSQSNSFFASLPTKRLMRFKRTESYLTDLQPLEFRGTTDVAIIGIGGRYPQADSLEELWKHLKVGDNCISKVPPGRWNNSLIQLLTGKQMDTVFEYYGGFLHGIQQFDHNLFEIGQSQVNDLPPEIRLFLEIVWETFEDAGYTKSLLEDIQNEYQEGIGVFVGTMYNQYPWTIPSLDYALINSNATDWHIANRISHFFNLTGPSVAVNSACSSSLTAIHLACESLRQRNCRMAIAGGVNLTLIPSKYDALQQINYLGSGNQSKSFGKGDGYIPGEGVGAVLLKPLKLALNDHDRIYAVIKSDFVNHSGGRQMYTVPDPKQQTQLIINSIRRSGIDPNTIGYVESAANGSQLGDPIEILALNNAFKKFTNQNHYCALGSVKSNLGHLEAASGISQLSKVLLQFKYKTLVPTINAKPMNPNIKLEGTAFYLQESIEPWKQFADPITGELLPRRSMINSFGAGGSYANLIVEEFQPEANQIQYNNAILPNDVLFIFSAKTEWSLMEYLKTMVEFLEKQLQIDYQFLAYALCKRNHHLDCRVAIIGSSIKELIEKIEAVRKSKSSKVDAGVYYELGQELNTVGDNRESIEVALRNQDLQTLATLWITGNKVDFRRMYQNIELPWIDLPKYVFDHNSEFGYEIKQMNAEMAEFYLDLSKKIANGELTEAEVAEIIFSIREQNNG